MDPELLPGSGINHSGSTSLSKTLPQCLEPTPFDQSRLQDLRHPQPEPPKKVAAPQYWCPQLFPTSLVLCGCDVLRDDGVARSSRRLLLAQGIVVKSFRSSFVSCNQCCGSRSVLDPYSGASWILIHIQNTDPDPHMQI